MHYKNISITLPQHMITLLDKEGNRSETIREALDSLFTQKAQKKISDLSLKEQFKYFDTQNKKLNIKKNTVKEIIEFKNKGRK